MATPKQTFTPTLPKTIRLLGKDIVITQEKPADVDDDDYGSWDDADLRVYVKPGQLPIEEIDTLIHETIHGISFIMHLDLEERQVRLLGSALAGLLQDNPEFAAFITRQVSRTKT